MVRLFVLCFATYSLFLTGNNPNVVSRIALAESIVERSTLTIDRLAPFTIDKAHVDAHYYLDKAPGLSFLATPTTFVVEQLGKVLRPGMPTDVGPNGTLTAFYFMIVYAATLGTVGLLAAVTVAAIYVWSVRHGASQQASVVGALTLAFATPFFGWSTLLFGHIASGCLLVLGYMALRHAMTLAELRSRRAAWTGLLGGVLLGAAFVVEYPAGLAVAIIGLELAGAALTSPERLRLLAVAFVPSAIGLVVVLVPLLLYNDAAFGSPFKLGYGAVVDWPGMQTGLFGLSVPRPNIAAELLFGQYRGLLPLSPVLILVPIGVVIAARNGQAILAIVASLVIVYYICMNSSYYYWDGGFSTGPRHMLPMLPMAAMLLPLVWDGAGRVIRLCYLALLVPSVLFSLASATVEVTAPDLGSSLGVARPLTELILPKFLDGDMHRLALAKFSWGQGFVGLVPLLLIWAVLGVPLLWSARRPVTAGVA